MHTDETGLSHDIVDRTEEKETLLKRMIYELDCGKCPNRDRFPVLRISICVRCYEKYRSRMTTLLPKSS